MFYDELFPNGRNSVNLKNMNGSEILKFNGQNIKFKLLFLKRGSDGFEI